jgi:3-oxoadipate enol-lactonase
VIVGEHDLVKPRKYSEIIVNQLTDVEYAIIPHAGHAVMWEQAGVFISLILGFLAKHRGQYSLQPEGPVQGPGREVDRWQK